jgi:hypothetical protein
MKSPEKRKRTSLPLEATPSIIASIIVLGEE